MRVAEKGRMSVSTEKCKNPGDYSEMVESVREPRKFPDEYLKRVESLSVAKNGRIQATTRKR